MRYSSIPLGVERPSIDRRNLARALIACSALLLFQGTPSWLRRGFLRKHLLDVARFYKRITKMEHLSAAASKLKARLDKDRGKLFTCPKAATWSCGSVSLGEVGIVTPNNIRRACQSNK